MILLITVRSNFKLNHKSLVEELSAKYSVEVSIADVVHGSCV